MTQQFEAGWYPDEGSAQLLRWWNGHAWTDALVSRDGTIDVARGVGQRIVTATAQGDLDQFISGKILESLAGLPPARIVQLQVSFSTFAMPHTSAIAVVEWQHPR